MWRCRYDQCLVTWRQRGWRKYGHYGPASTSSHQQPAPINYPFGCIWKHRDGALCWHSYDDIMGTLGIMVWLGDSDTLTMCNISPHQVKFQRSYVTNDGRSAISCVTPVLVSVWPVVSVNRLFAASLSEIESAAADWGLTGTRLLLLSAHTFSHRENPHHTVQCRQSGYSLSILTSFTVPGEVPTRAFSLLKAPSNAFTMKNLLRHYTKQAFKHGNKQM